MSWGTEEDFAKLMNVYANKLGMKNTNFINSSGWPEPDHFSTVKDLAILSAAIIENFPKMYELFKLKSFKYNQEICFPFKYHAEKLYRKDNIYDIFINIKYNYLPIIKGKGSAIFLHLSNSNYKPTSGCIAIVKKDFLKILPLINKKTKISIT